MLLLFEQPAGNGPYGSSTSTSTSTSTKASTKSPVRKGSESVQLIPRNTEHDAEQVIVTAHLDRARSELSPTTGASVYRFSRQALENIPGGDNAPLNQVLLQAPGVAQDSYGQIHVRGDHNEVQFRLDGVQLPEGLNVFGQALMTRFADNMSLTTGALPSQFGFLQAAVVDITTKNGTTNPGGNLSFYGGARDYFFPSLQYGFHKGKWDFFATADFVHDRVGIENTTSSFNAPHDLSNQYHFLGHARYTVDEDTRISLIAGISNAEYQLPNNPGQDWNTNYTPPAGTTANSASLNEHQKQITDFAVLALQKEIGAFSLQDSVFTRYSSLRYSPDMAGDLLYLGNAQQAARSVFSTGTQHDVTWRAAPQHTVRFGFQMFVERNVSKTASTVFSNQIGTDSDDNPIYDSQTTTKYDGSGKTGMVYGLYAQDEWQPLRNLTINYGLRFDGVSEYTSEHQVSPRVNVVWKPWHGGTLHAGYSRYFTPPPFEVVSGSSLYNLNNTSGQSNSTINSKVRAERDHYFDAGFDQTILPGWHISFDAYYKLAKNLIDEGQFGAPIILSGFNYRHGQVNGYEVSTSYDRGPLSLYGNFAWSRAIGKQITSAQFNFDANELAYISNHWVHLDHDQRWSASAGAAYTFFRKTRAPLRLSATMVYGSGLRADDDVNGIPNGLALTPYATVNFSAVQTIHNTFGSAWPGDTQLRLDVMNLGDHTYMLRDGSGIGVGAPQYGLRRTILCGISQGF
ncbi:TonB-dependent receptor [Acetobacter okinawensis]|uniref:TonB-dependent receptor n=1 Tax=Acetobacter okinawensis TaxID=1076594 RepID=UPI001BA591EC|nr:TonB-dependent receptor [Acetobacter okinawensis]MBS0989830.1 TonB-dependent receptor [Acetobacter okinawensis]